MSNIKVEIVSKSIGQRLEAYTSKRPQEVLIVTLETEGELDQVMIFKGFSSSLMHPTNYDPDVPIIPLEAKIIEIDRASSPYNPDDPHYLQRGLTQAEMESLLSATNI